MSMIETISARHIPSVITPRHLADVKKQTGNVYAAIVVSSKRANQINDQIMREIHARIEEFGSSHTDTFEEVQENQEQIDISRAYEALPCPALIALDEFLHEELIFDKEKQTLTFDGKYKKN